MNMNFNLVKNIGGKVYMKLRKYSPELALGGAIVCGIGAVVTACKASRHVDEILDEAQEELNDILDAHGENVDVNVRKESMGCYLRTGWKLVRLYGPTIVLGTSSIGLMLTSHGILNKRYLGTAAAYEALDNAFKTYRKRVAAAIGEEAEKIIMADGKPEKNIKVQNEDGTIEEVNGEEYVIGELGNSPYEFDFNHNTAPTVWENCADYNEARLRAAQTYFTDILNTRGHVFLNEVLDELGLKRTPAGAVCGWVRGCGDGYVDFGYMDTYFRDYRIDSDLCKKNIHLNFNCDGVIWDLI